MTTHKMNLKIQYVLGSIMTIFLIVVLLKNPSDRNTTVFAFILYFPYVIGLCLYNGLILRMTKKMSDMWYYYFIPIIPGIIWLLVSKFKLTVRFWEFNVFESVTIVFLWTLANLMTPKILTRKNYR